MAVVATHPVKRPSQLAKLAVALVALVAVLLLAIAHVMGVHARYGEWAWAPTATPPKLEFEMQNYVRSNASGVVDPETAIIRRGTIPGGTPIYAVPKVIAPPVIYVRQRSQLVEYFRLGGGD